MEPAYTIPADSSYMLAVMVIAGRNQNASRSDPAYLLGKCFVCVLVCSSTFLSACFILVLLSSPPPPPPPSPTTEPKSKRAALQKVLSSSSSTESETDSETDSETGSSETESETESETDSDKLPQSRQLKQQGAVKLGSHLSGSTLSLLPCQYLRWAGVMV